MITDKNPNVSTLGAVNTRFFMIGGAVILLLVGIGAFLVYYTNVSVQEVRVYEVPDPIVPSVETNLGTTGATVAIAAGKQTGLANNNSSESDQRDEDTASMGESAIEPCCPEEVDSSLAGDIDFEQNSNLDHNPVSPELIADMKRDAEWFVAIKAWEKKYDALHAEGDQLDEESNMLIEEAKTLEGAALEAFVPKLKAQIAKGEDWSKKLEALKREKPIRPTPTHTH